MNITNHYEKSPKKGHICSTDEVDIRKLIRPEVNEDIQ